MTRERGKAGQKLRLTEPAQSDENETSNYTKPTLNNFPSQPGPCQP